MKPEEPKHCSNLMTEGGSQRKYLPHTHLLLQIRNDWAAYCADSPQRKISEHAATHKWCRQPFGQSAAPMLFQNQKGDVLFMTFGETGLKMRILGGTVSAS